MIMAQEKHFIKTRKEFDALLGWIGPADGEGLRMDQIERGLFARLLAIGFILLEDWSVALKGVIFSLFLVFLRLLDSTGFLYYILVADARSAHGVFDSDLGPGRRPCW